MHDAEVAVDGFLIPAAVIGRTAADASKVKIQGIYKNKKLNKYSNKRNHIANISMSRDVSNLIIVRTTSENQQPLNALIDSAAQCEVITQGSAKRLGLTVTASNARLVSAQGDNLEVVGKVNFNIQFGANNYNVTAVVTPKLMSSCDVILGISFLNRNHTMVTRPGQSPKFTIDSYEIPLIRERNVQGMSVFTIKDIGEDNVVEWA